jgi:hypothetical protein
VRVTGLWKPRIASVLGGASFAYLAVETSSGPHVTPLLFAATPDRLWFVIGRGTLKARVVTKQPAVGVVVPGEDASIAIRGEATLLDRLPASPAELARAPFGLPAFAFRNVLEGAAFARDAARRGERLQPVAPLSVGIEPSICCPRSAAACVSIDESDGLGPLAKRGRLLRGQGHARLRGGIASVPLQVERVTRWKGFQTQTAPVT